VGTTRIAKWNGSSWSAMGSGMDNEVAALAVSGSTIYAGGRFSTAGGVTVNHIAKWNGSSWSVMGSGMGSDVFALAVSGSSLYAGGSFTTAGGVAANYIAKWNGSAWSALGSGVDSWVRALAVTGSDVYAGGHFSSAGGVSANRIAKWNGSTWNSLGTGITITYDTEFVSALAVSGTDLYAGGGFTRAGAVDASNIAKWNGSAWSALGSGMGHDGFQYSVAEVNALAVSGTNLYVGGEFLTAGGKVSGYLARGLIGTPEMAISGNGVGIADGDSTPAVADHTDFGSTITTGGSVVRTFTVTNSGTSSLTLTGAPKVAIGGTNAADFTVSVMPASPMAATNGSTTFQVTFDPSTSGTRTATVSLANEDSDENPYNFSIQGTGFQLAVTASTANLTSTTTTLTLTGTGFSTTPGQNIVAFTPSGTGTVTASTATSLTVTGLSGLTPGALNAVVTSQGFSSGAPVQVATVVPPPAPTVTGISPSSGSTLGGTSVTITGTNFTGATAVTIGGTAATSVSVVNATTITCITPAGTAGTASVLATTPGGTNAANTFYTYVAPPPSVTLSTANLLTTATTLTITGANFSTTPGNNTVAFTPAGTGTVTAATATTLTVTSLSGLTVGALSAVVTTSGLSSGAAVQVATVVATGTGAPDSLDANIVGTFVLATAVQPDGKTIIAGNFNSVLGQPRNNIARLNADGTLDAGFNPNTNGSIYSAAVQADGKILLGGFFTSVGGTVRNNIARVAADGTLDAGFNPNANSAVYSMAVQADGKILLGGEFTSMGGTTRNRIARVAGDGTLDAGFNPNASSVVASVAVQADGLILLGGWFTTVGGTVRNYIARVAANGTLDAGFNPSANNIVRSVAVQVDGKILLGGEFTSMSGTTRNRIARVAADGTLDAGFNPSANYDVYSVVMQADGKILLGGAFTSVGGIGRNYIARVLANGTLDTGFNPNANNGVLSVAVQADGKILLGGTFTSVGGTGRNYLARLLNDPATLTLSAVDATQVIWTRGGSSPEVSQVTFELSTNGGSSYTLLGGTATRVGTTANWQLSGLSLPVSGQLRARGRTAGGYNNGSSGLVEQVSSFSLAAAPTVTGISPASGTTMGGTSVTITGTGFTGATAVSIGGTAATSLSVVNATTITCITPARAAGAASVLVTTPGGTNAANTLYTYVAPPTVTGISPSSGTTLGGTSVTITGTNFTGATAVTIGGTAATSISVVNATTITCITPARAAGTASVLVTKPGGTNAANTLYTYVPPINLPEIVVEQSAVDIPDGGSKAFGYVTIGSAVDLVFTVRNTGGTDLTLGGTPKVVVSGPHAGLFTVIAQPTSPVVAGGSTTFTVRFAPTSTGAKTAALSIANNDSDEEPFDISLSGTGQAFSAIVADNFDRANQTLAGTAPPTTVISPSPLYGSSGASGNYWQVVAISGNRVILDTDVGLSVPISSAGSYVKPTRFRISASLNLGTVSGGVDNAARGIGLGTYTGFTPNPTEIGLHGHDNGARGLVLELTGKITLSTSGSLDSGLSLPYQSALFGGASFNPGVPHTLAYEIDTAAGSISNIELDGVPLGSLTTNVFTAANTPRVGFWVSSSAGGRSGFVDDFLVQGVSAGLIGDWQQTYFGAATTNTGPLESFTGDGIPNLLKFAFGVNPTAAGAPALQYTGTFAGSGTITATGQPITRMEGADIRAVFVRRKDYLAAGLTYTAQFSATLGLWEDSVAVPTVLADDGTNQIVSVPYPALVAGLPGRFFRIRVTITP